MFSFTLRSLMRRAPCVTIVATGGTAMTGYPQQCTHYSQCEEKKTTWAAGPTSALRSHSVRSHDKADPYGIPLGVGKQFMELYAAEFANVNGQVDLEHSLNITETKHLLEAAGGKPNDATKMFELMDAYNNRVNAIDYVDVVAYFCNHGMGSFEEKASFFFNACDLNSAGSLGKAELKRVVHHMMMQKKDTEGRDSFMVWHKSLYENIPQTYVIVLKANELVEEIFTTAAKDGEHLSEKEFKSWLMKGGKNVNRLIALLGCGKY